MEKFGIKNFTAVVLFAGTVGMTVDKTLADKKVDLNDLQNIFPLFQDIPNFRAALPHFKEEWKDMHEAEKEEVKAEVKAKFDLKNDQTEAFIENAFGLALSLDGLIKQFEEIRSNKSGVQSGTGRVNS